MLYDNLEPFSENFKYNLSKDDIINRTHSYHISQFYIKREMKYCNREQMTML